MFQEQRINIGLGNGWKEVGGIESDYNRECIWYLRGEI